MRDRSKPPHRGIDVLTFLDRHRLSHTPYHYSFAHEYLSGDDDNLRVRVDTAIDGGVRLTEDQVTKLRPAGVPHRLLPDLDHLTLRILDVVGDAMAITGDLNRDLIGASATLLDEPERGIGPLIAAMLRRAEDAEASFALAARRARDIREELSALQTEGQHDPLTGLPNRKALEERISTASASHGCLGIVDVDHLRRINEGHSPAVGDRLLKVVAQTLADFCHGHMVARWEGGAFAVLFDRTHLGVAGELLNNVCEAVSAREMRVRETDAPVGRISLSAGIVALRSRSGEAVMQAATDQLRRAKQGGRDQVSIEDGVIGMSKPD